MKTKAKDVTNVKQLREVMRNCLIACQDRGSPTNKTVINGKLLNESSSVVFKAAYMSGYLE